MFNSIYFVESIFDSAWDEIEKNINNSDLIREEDTLPESESVDDFSLEKSNCSCLTTCGFGRYIVAGTEQGNILIRDQEVQRIICFGNAFSDGKTIEKIACSLVPGRLFIVAALAYPPTEKRPKKSIPTSPVSTDLSPQPTDEQSTSPEQPSEPQPPPEPIKDRSFGKPCLSIFFIPLVAVLPFYPFHLYHLFNFETLRFLEGERKLLDYFSFSLSLVNRRPNRLYLCMTFFAFVNVFEV